jgi:hypothetical protein
MHRRKYTVLDNSLAMMTCVYVNFRDHKEKGFAAGQQQNTSGER